MPTRRGIVLLAAGIALVASGRFLALVELGTLGLVLVSLVVVVCLSVCFNALRARHLTGLTFTRTHPPSYVFADRPFPVALVGNGRNARVPLCSVTESLGRKQPESTGTTVAHGASDRRPPRATESLLHAGLCRTGDLRYERQFPRGIHALGPGRVTAVDSLGLARIPLTSIPATQVVVWPNAVDIGVDAVARLFSESHTGFDTEAGDLRHYVPGDDLRRVHWATTARTSRLMVRGTDHVSRSHEARRIVLDASASSHRGSSFDLAVSVAASLLLSADPEERIDFIIDGPSGEQLYPTIGLAMAALATVSPDRQSTLQGIDTILDWKAGIVVVGEQTPIPQRARGPVIRCATSLDFANDSHDLAVPGQTVVQVTTLDSLGAALADVGQPPVSRRSLRFGT